MVFKMIEGSPTKTTTWKNSRNARLQVKNFQTLYGIVNQLALFVSISNALVQFMDVKWRIERTHRVAFHTTNLTIYTLWLEIALQYILAQSINGHIGMKLMTTMNLSIPKMSVFWSIVLVPCTLKMTVISSLRWLQICWKKKQWRSGWRLWGIVDQESVLLIFLGHCPKGKVYRVA